MPKKLILIRHGRTDFNAQKIIQGQIDSFLTPEGLVQARRAGELLARHEVDVIFTSDLKRAHHTALTIAERIQKKLIITPLLRERYFGKLQGLKREEIVKILPNFTTDEDFSHFWWEGEFEIETNDMVQERLKLFMTLLQKEHSEKNILVVSHSGTLRVFFEVLGYRREFAQTVELNNATPIVLENQAGRFILLP